MKYIIFVVLAIFSKGSFAVVSLGEFSWRQDGQFTLSLKAEKPMVIKGSLRDGGKSEAISGPVTVDLQSYLEGFVTVTVAVQGQSTGSVFLLERQNSLFLPLNSAAISARTATMSADLEGILAALKKNNGWDTSLALRSMTDYFSSNPKRQLSDYFDQVELGNVKAVAKPAQNPRTSSDQTVQTQALPQTEPHLRRVPRRRYSRDLPPLRYLPPMPEGPQGWQ